MNMNCHKAVNVGGESVLLRKSMIKLIKNSLVRKILKQNGYRLIDYPSSYSEASAKNTDALVISMRGNIFAFELAPIFIENTPLRFLALEFSKDVDLKSVLIGENFLKGEPKFYFVHFVDVHENLCTERSQKIQQNVLCSANREILNFVKKILISDPTSIVIMQADHGFPSQIDMAYNTSLNAMRNIAESDSSIVSAIFRHLFGIFSAVYVPDDLLDKEQDNKLKTFFAGGFSLINVFRMLFAVLSKEEPDLLPDRHFWVDQEELNKSGKNMARFVELTRTIDER
jgi:hypothetical protein